MTRSVASKRRLSSAIRRGVVAIRIAAVEEATFFSPAAIIGKGIAISATAKAQSQRP